MKEIRMKSVGPISNLSMSFDNGINVIIGEQASGKSTLAKEVYFFKKIRDYFVEYVSSPDRFTHRSLDEQYLSFLKFIRAKYMESFGTTKHLPSDYFLRYEYGKNASVHVELDNKNYVKIVFSPQLVSGIKNAIEAVKKVYENQKNNEKDFYNSFMARQNMKEEISLHFRSVADQLFKETGDIVYIPAGRSMLSVLSEQLDVVDVKNLDLPMRDFVQRIRELKPSFGKKLEDVVADYLKTVKGQIKNRDVELAQALIKQILQGDYVSDNTGEKMYIDDNHWVKLIFSSSGQQEVLWILNILFISLLENKKTFFIIEEPEAHLFPYAQKTIIELIALTHNSNGSQMLITTHSPYILTSMNLLIFSSNVESKTGINEDCVIEKKLRLSKGTVKAYRFKKKSEESLSFITDENSGLINSEEIDEVSIIINDYTDRLIRKEFGDDM